MLKKLNKTYGGSILTQKDMLQKTLEKFKLYCKNHGVKKTDEANYRVFVPYNNQMP